MGWSYFEQRVVWILDTTRRLSTSAGRWAIAATLVAGVVGTLLPSLIEVGDGEWLALGAEFQVGKQTAAGGTQPATAAFTPSSRGPRQAVQGHVVDPEGKNKPAGASEASQPKPKPASSVPITGRVVDREGRPVSGATVRVARVVKGKGGDLKLWIEAIRQGRFWAADNYLIDSSPITPKEKQPTATTDAQGRFRFEGFGAEQILALTIQGPTIASTSLAVITRRTDPIAARGFWIYGADFTVTVSPMRPVEGVVRDAKTRQPLAGVEIRTNWFSTSVWRAGENLRTTTNIQGRFRLVGLSKEGKNNLLIVPKDNQPYFTQEVAVANTASLDLRLMPKFNDVIGNPNEARNLIIVSTRIDGIHIRIFDGEGKVVVDTDEKRLAEKFQQTEKFNPVVIRMLKKELQSLWPPHELTRGEKDRVILFLTSLAGYNLPEPPANVPVQMEIDLHRGLWIEGKVTDKETGRPVAVIPLHYDPFLENQFARGMPEFVDLNGRGDFYDTAVPLGSPHRYETKLDGTYRLVGLPGRGIVGVYLGDKPYLQVGYGGLDAQGRFQVDSPTADPLSFRRRPGTRFPTPVKEISPSDGAETFRVDFELVAGARVRLRVVDPHGQPVTGVKVAFLIQPERVFADRHASAEFDVAALAPNEHRMVLIRHEERKLGKVVSVGAGDDKNGPVVVTLEPLATIVGRVIEAGGKPGTSVAIKTRVFRHFSLRLEEVSTDGDGKFVVPDVPVGCQYKIEAEATTADKPGTGYTSRSAEASKPVSVLPGQTTDVGEIRFEDDP